METLATTLKEDYCPGKYDRVFMNYLLPGMNPGSGSWASTHYDPALKVQIMGLTIDEEARLTERSRKLASSGCWRDEGGMGSVVCIARNESSLTMLFKSGGDLDRPLTKKVLDGQTRYYSDVSTSGDYYVVADTGNLEVYDDDGLIAIYLKIP